MPPLQLTRRGAEALVPPRRRLGPVGGRLAQELSIAALLGGNLFGRTAMGPALADIADKPQRGQVLNHAWRRYGTVNSLALAGLIAGWTSERGHVPAAPWARRRRDALVLAKDVAVGAVVVTGLASAAGGVGFARQASDGAVPMDDGSEPAAETPERARSLKRTVNVLGGLNLAAELGLVGIDALLDRGVPGPR